MILDNGWIAPKTSPQIFRNQSGHRRSHIRARNVRLIRENIGNDGGCIFLKAPERIYYQLPCLPETGILAGGVYRGLYQVAKLFGERCRFHVGVNILPDIHVVEKTGQRLNLLLVFNEALQNGDFIIIGAAL